MVSGPARVRGSHAAGNAASCPLWCSASAASLHAGSSAASRRAHPDSTPGRRARPAARSRQLTGGGRVCVCVLRVLSLRSMQPRVGGCAGGGSCSPVRTTDCSAHSRPGPPKVGLLSPWSASRIRSHGSGVNSPCIWSNYSLSWTWTLQSFTVEWSR